MPLPEDPQRPPAGDLARVLEMLARHHVLSLACRDGEGTWAAAVFFANDGLDLYFLSSPLSRHARSLAFDPVLAGVIHGPADDWRSIIGLQVQGQAEAIAAADVPSARSVYAKRFPFMDESDAATDPALAQALEKAAWYRLRISEAVLVDNTRGLGQRIRWSISSA
jgi:hypothetical protein